MINTATLQAAYQTLRDYLTEMRVYDQDVTPGFDRQKLAGLFTAYYDAEAAVRAGVASMQTQPQLDELAKDKDSIAKGLGYADYAEMAAAADSGKTIIDGGFISADIIKSDRITAKNILTASTGKRIEIIGARNSIQAFDAEGEEKIVISGEETNSFTPAPTSTSYIDTSDVGDFHPPITFEFDPRFPRILYQRAGARVACEFYYSGREITKIPSFVLRVNIQNKLNIIHGYSGIQALSTYSIVIIAIQKLNPSTGEWVLSQELLRQKTYESVINTTYRSAAIDSFVGDGAGLYRVQVVFSSSCTTNDFEQNIPGQIWYADVAYTLKVDSSVITVLNSRGNYSALYSNGLVSYWGAGQYFGVLQLQDNDFVKGVYGKYGFKLNDKSGFTLSTNANDTSPKWNMPMNCVVMGKGIADGTKTRYRACDSNIIVTSRRISAGNYQLDLKNPAQQASSYFGSASDYTIMAFNSKIGHAIHAYACANTASQFSVLTFTYNIINTDADFVFFVIDNRNWTT